MDQFLSHILILILAIVPSLGWMFVYRFFDSRDPEPLVFSYFGLLMGIFSTLPVFALQILFTNFPEYNLVSVLQNNVQNVVIFSILFLLFVAFVEESIKGLAFLFLAQKVERDFNQVVDGLFYGALVGIGFALAENIYYFLRALETFSYSSNFMAIFTIRSFGTMLAHTLFTGIFGFYYAKAYFSPFLNKKSKKEKLWKNLPGNVLEAVKLKATFFHLMPRKNLEPGSFKRNVIILEGYLMAILVHFLYNGFIKLELFGRNWTFMVMPLLFVVAWYLWSRFFIKIYILIIDFVRQKGEFYKAKIK